jgi:hypothetical protein
MGVFGVVVSPVRWFNYQFRTHGLYSSEDTGDLVYEGIAPAVSAFSRSVARSGIPWDAVAFCLTRRNGMALRRVFPLVVATAARTEQ